jgi:RNA polymerase sigma-70 factor, ECF subfamily
VQKGDRVNVEEAAWRRELARGDPEARARFYERYLDDVLGWCWRLGGGTVEPEDAAHDVFVVALSKVSAFRGDSSLRTWLFGVTRRVLANKRRRVRTRRSREQLVPEHSGRFRSPGPGPLEEALRDEELAQVHRCLETLSRKDREVLVLSALEGRPAREVAELIGTTEGAVYTRLHHARKRFKRVAQRLGLQSPAEKARRGTKDRGGEGERG